MSVYRCVQLLLFSMLLGVSIVRYVQARQDNPVKPSCSANGHYCQMHHECCSGKCMTYSYMCAPRVPEKYPESSYNPTGFNYLDEFVWPLYYVNRPRKPDVQIVTLPDDKSTTTRSEFDESSSQTAEKAGTTYEINNSPNRAPPQQESCKRVGEECSDSRECCKKRCHTYLHKCVT